MLPSRVLEIGTRVWAHDREFDPLDASTVRIFSIGLVEGMAVAARGALEQQGDTPRKVNGGGSPINSERPTRRFSSWAIR